MRHLKSIALLTALAFGGASAAVDSTSSGYSSAETTVGATGTYASAVSFTVPSSSLTIPSAQVRPGATFTVTVPVSNTTDRGITISAGTVTKPANVTVDVTTGSADVVAGASGVLAYTITFDADSAAAAALSGNANFTFQLLATDTAAAPTNLSY